MQDYEETHELNTIAPEKTPSPDYPPEVRIEMSTVAWRMMYIYKILLVYFQYGLKHFNVFENVHILFAWDETKLCVVLHGLYDFLLSLSFFILNS